MGDAKRRKHLGIEPEPIDPQERRKRRVMARAKSEPLRPRFLLDLGRALASDGCESIECTIPFANDAHYSSLANGIGIALQVIPSIICCSPSPSHFGKCILTIECLSKEPPSVLFEYIKQQLSEGVTLQVGYDRAYQGRSEYVVPLIIEYVPTKKQEV